MHPKQKSTLVFNPVHNQAKLSNQSIMYHKFYNSASMDTLL